MALSTPYESSDGLDTTMKFREARKYSIKSENKNSPLLWVKNEDLKIEKLFIVSRWLDP